MHDGDQAHAECVLFTASPRGHVPWSGAVCHLGQWDVLCHCPVWELGSCCISYFSRQVLDSAASLPGSEVHGSQGGEVRGAHRTVSTGVWAGQARTCPVASVFRKEW